MLPGVQDFDSDGKPICPICGKSFKRLIAHTRQKHFISAKQYRLMFGFCKGTSFLSKESKELSRQMVFRNYHIVENNLIKCGMKTRIRKGMKTDHTMTPERYLIIEENRKQKVLKPNAKCSVCNKELTSRKGRLCLQHYREAMGIRNKK